ncbi:hypothetical protein RUM44_000675 [Polyplax serrata]|uniref:NADP-dependent oxidoreductase domain-containing protein n=1 Tax=Polyplax serrata TaxID=468196 RepID=A0ABR1B8C0_POLSC
MAVPVVKLNNGYSMPAFGLGTWQAVPGDVEKAVKTAIDLGYRHFDCALVYRNEAEVGSAIRQKIKEGAVKREDLFVVSKEHEEFFPKDENGKALLADYDYVDTWKEMEKCVELGLTKSIGLSNFNSQQIDRVLKAATIKPTVNQVECHAYLNQKKLIEFCKSRDIIVTGYSPLGSATRPWAAANDPVLLDDPKLKEIATRLGKTVAQIALRYLVQSGVAPIPKSANPVRLMENINIFDFQLSDEDMKAIDGLHRNFRICGFRE